MAPRVRDESGFTLIEIIVSLAVISIALVTLMTVFNRTVAAAAESGVLTDAVMIAKEKIALAGSAGESSSSAGKTKAGTGEWTDDERYPRYRYRRVITEVSFYSVDVYMVEIEVQHDEKDIFTLAKYLRKES